MVTQLSQILSRLPSLPVWATYPSLPVWAAYPLITLNTIVVITLFNALIRKYKNPEKTFRNALISVILTPFRVLQLGPFSQGEITIAKCMKWAMKKTNLQDFGDKNEQFLKNYEFITESPIHAKQKFTNLGYLSYKLEMPMVFARRLNLIEYLKQYPEVLKVPVVSPVFVMGLPRTGTTLLHRLLSLDTKRFRAPLLWELLNPVPSRNKDGNYISIHADKETLAADQEKRFQFIKKLIDQRKKLGDKALEHIHEVGADLPEECIMALTDEIPVGLAMLYSGYMQIDKYLSGKQIRVDLAYEFYRKYFQLLSAQIGESSKPRSWMLKCPFHLFNVPEIAKAYPDAKFIWTHRHPVAAVPSLCSLLKAVHQIYYDKSGRDDHALGRAVSAASADILVKCPEDLKKANAPCAHALFSELEKDPEAVVKGIYRQFGWEYTQEYDDSIKAYMAKNREEREQLAKKKGGKTLHRYSPEEFGLTKESLSTGKYEEYVKLFNISQK